MPSNSSNTYSCMVDVMFAQVAPIRPQLDQGAYLVRVKLLFCMLDVVHVRERKLKVLGMAEAMALQCAVRGEGE